jgi:hypothetical protein
LPASNRFTTQYDLNTGVARLKINDSVLNDAGVYTVVAENKAGSDRTNGRLELEKEGGVDTQPIVNPNAFAGLHHVPPAPPHPAQFGGDEPARPAKVVIPLQTTQVPDGKPARLACRVDGYPRPTVVWYKNGLPLPAANRFTVEYDLNTGVCALRIDSAQLSDSARYELYCDNPLGSDRTNANLSVSPSAAIDRTPIVDPRSFRYLDQPSALVPPPPVAQEVYRGPDVDRVEPPRVVIPLKDTRAPEGQSVCLLTKITGVPQPRIVWLHNNQPLLESSRYTSTYDHTTCVASFKIAGTQVNDVGTYTAVADNPGGQCYTTCMLQLTQDSLVDTTPIVNPDAFKYLEKPTLSHPHKKPPTEAVVADALPSGGRPPCFIVQLSDVRGVSEGQACQLSAKLEGYPYPTVSWFKDGRPLPASNRTLVHYNLNSGVVSLKIADAQLADHGHYTVVAVNKLGQDQTQAGIAVTQMPGVDSSSLVNPEAFRYLEPQQRPQQASRRPEDRDRLNYKPPKFIIQLANIKINEGQPAHLAAKVDGYPKPRVSFFFIHLKKLGLDNLQNENREFGNGIYRNFRFLFLFFKQFRNLVYKCGIQERN